MLVDPDILHLRFWNEDLLVGPQAAFGGYRACRPESGAGVEALFGRQMMGSGGLHGLKGLRARWQGRLGGAAAGDRSLVARVVAGVDARSLLAFRAVGRRFARSDFETRPSAALLRQLGQPQQGRALPRAGVSGSSAPPALRGAADAGRGTARIEDMPVELRLAEVFRRVRPPARAEFAAAFPPESTAQAVAVLTRWSEEKLLRPNVVLYAMLRAPGLHASARETFALVDDIERVLDLVLSSAHEAGRLDEASLRLAAALAKAGSAPLRSAFAAGAERVGGMPPVWTPPKPTPARQQLRRPMPVDDDLPAPAKVPPVPVVPPDSPACAAARVAEKKLSELKDEARLASHAYMDEAERLADPIKGYEPILEEKALNEIGLSKKDLKIDGTAFRAVVYRKLSDNSIVSAFQGSTLDAADWKNNAAQALNQEMPNSYYAQAQRIAKALDMEARKTKSQAVKFVGHSLGGGLASAAARAIGADATTFNAAGLHPKTVEDIIEGGRIKAVNVKGEILTSLQKMLPLPEAASDGDVISFDPPLGIGRDILLPLLGFVAGAIPGLAAGMALRSGLLHKMGAVHDCVDEALRDARDEVDKACGGSAS